MWKFGLFWLPRPFNMILAFLAQNWSNFDRNGPILTLLSPNPEIFWKISNQCLKSCGKVVLFGSRLLDKVLDLWANLDQLLDPDYAALTSLDQHLDILWNIHTLGLKLGRNLVFFGFLGQLIWFWPFWPKLVQFWSKWDNFETFKSKS